MAHHGQCSEAVTFPQHKHPHSPNTVFLISCPSKLLSSITITISPLISLTWAVPAYRKLPSPLRQKSSLVKLYYWDVTDSAREFYSPIIGFTTNSGGLTKEINVTQNLTSLLLERLPMLLKLEQTNILVRLVTVIRILIRFRRQMVVAGKSACLRYMDHREIRNAQVLNRQISMPFSRLLWQAGNI